MKNQDRASIKKLMQQREQLQTKGVASPTEEASDTNKAPAYTPKADPQVCLSPKEAVLYSHTSEMAEPHVAFVIKPQEKSDADGYNRFRTPSGYVRQTLAGQQVEFFDRVYVPPSTYWRSNRIWLSTAVPSISVQ